MSAPLSRAQINRLACPDWFERLQAGRPPIPDLELNIKEAANAVSIFNKLRLPDVPGQPELKTAAADWSRDLVSNIFGTVVTDKNGIVLSRLVRKFFLLIPKKNAKTTNGAGIMLTALIKNLRPRGVFLLIGPTETIAELAFSQIVGMINADSDNYLQSRFKIVESKNEIVDLTNQAVLVVKAFSSDVMTGQKPVGVLVDELHILGTKAKASAVMKQIQGGIIANPEGFVIFISTQSDDAPAGIFKTQLELARSIRDGEFDGDLLPMLYEWPLDMQKGKKAPWEDVNLWSLVLPNLGRSIQLDVLVAEYKEAQHGGKEELALWLSQHLNVQIGLGMHKDRWRGADYWPSATDADLDFLKLQERSEVVTVGIDGGGLDDLFGFSAIGRCKETKEWLLWSHAWAHPDVLENRKGIAERLADFVAEGSLTLCEYPTQEIDGAAFYCDQLLQAGLLPDRQAIGLDPMGISALIDALIALNFTEDQLCAIPQGYKLSGAIWGMERSLKNGKLRHCDQPMMDWCVGNAKAEQRGNALLITKQAAGKAKIDPLIAAFNAFALMTRNPIAASARAASYLDATDLVLV